MVNKIVTEFPNDFEISIFLSTQKEGDGFKIIDIEDYNTALKSKKYVYNKFNMSTQEYVALEKEEVDRIQNSGKIAIIEIDLEGAKKLKNLDVGANFVGILPPSLDALRARIKEHTKLSTADINKQLETAEEEIKEIEKYTFFVFRIINDDLDTGLKDIKNAMISLYPKLKYTEDLINEIKNSDFQESENKESDSDAKMDNKEDGQGIKEEANEEEQKENIIFVLGGPGSGKGTQCKRIISNFKYESFSTGDILRSTVKDKMEGWEEIDALMKEGKLISSEIIMRLLKNAIDRSKNRKILIDGYPRNQENVDEWDKQVGNSITVKACIYIDVEPDEMRKRILGRGEGRADDNEETIKKRLATFEQETKPLVDVLKNKGIPIIRIDGMRGVDEISEDIAREFKERGLD